MLSADIKLLLTFPVLNLLSFAIIAICYLLMYIETRRSRQAVRRNFHRVHNTGIAKRMTLIVATDALCWLPIIGLGLASLGGIKVPPQVSKLH